MPERGVRRRLSGQDQAETTYEACDGPETLQMAVRSGRSPFTRRRLLKGLGGAAGLAAVGAGVSGVSRLLGGGSGLLGPFLSTSAGQVRSFVSRPDLQVPVVAITGADAAPGYVFLGPHASGGSQPGPLIVDGRGDAVWFKPLSGDRWATNFRVGRYQGQPVLTWWEGKVVSGYGQGEGVIADSTYREIARVRAGNGRQVDLHEFLLTPQGTALFTCYPNATQADLSAVGGPSDGTVLESIIQEVDIQSGRVLFEWRSLKHVPVSESYRSVDSPYDYMHANSIDLTPDGNILISARHTWALYRVDRQTGQVTWRLGGKRSDFQMGKDSQFSWQHDARQLTATLFSVFDDGAGPRQTESQSRGIMLDVDAARKTVRLVRSYRHPKSLLATALGSVQELPGGHVFVGWGSEPYVSEFAADGTLLADIRLGAGHDSYRAFRYPWSGVPAEAPAIATRRAASGQRALYVSWNGATEVAGWQVRTGPSATDLRPLGIARRRGFETAIALGSREGYIAAVALDASGRPLASSRTIRL